MNKTKFIVTVAQLLMVRNICTHCSAYFPSVIELPDNYFVILLFIAAHSFALQQNSCVPAENQQDAHSELWSHCLLRCFPEYNISMSSLIFLTYLD